MADSLPSDLLLDAYARGIFPMAESRDATELVWLDPHLRGIFELEHFHMSRSLRRRIRKQAYRATLNRDFSGVLARCAAREETWINPTIAAAYEALHRRGNAHSVEIWHEEQLVGGVYGVTLGAAFFGESMFSTRTDASKVALAFLTTHLAACGFALFDTQFLTPHLASLGALEISRAEYRRRLALALRQSASITSQPLPDAASVLQRSTHTS